MAEGHAERNGAQAVSKDPAKGFREVTAPLYAALITSMECLDQELTAMVNAVTACPCQWGAFLHHLLLCQNWR